MDEVEQLAEEVLLLPSPEEAEEAEEAAESWWEPWLREEAVVPLWLAVLLVTWSLLAISHWLAAPPHSARDQAQGVGLRARRSLRSVRLQSQASRQQQGRVPAAAAAPTSTSTATSTATPASTVAMAAPPQPEPLLQPPPAKVPRLTPQSTAEIVPPPQSPQPQSSDESLEEPPQPLPPATINHVNVLLDDRLWHEASLELLRLVSEPDSSLVKNEEQARTLLSHHIMLLHKRASPVVVSQIAAQVSDWLPDVEERRRVLQEFTQKAAGSAVAAAVCRLHQAQLTLLQEPGAAAAADAALPVLVEVEEQLLETPEVVPQEVSATCYRLLALCYHIKEDLPRYQDAALKYLCHVDPMGLPEEERESIASELVVCALLSDDINATAEMRLRPVVRALEKSSTHGWLTLVLEAVDDGAVGATRAAAPLLQQEPRLHRRASFILEKAAIRALQAVCRSKRRVTMEEAAEATRQTAGEAEQTVLRALARGAVDGRVDGDTLCVERVRPSPVGVLKLLPDINKLDKWLNLVADQENTFASQMDNLIGL